jgi:hypothetical protein
VWLWKGADEARGVATRVLDELIAGVDERRKATAPRGTYLADIKRRLDAATKYSFATDDLLVLNFIALGYPSHLPAIARHLEAELGLGYFVEIGHRVSFKPIKDPDTYEIVGHDGKLVPLVTVSPSSVQAVQALWFENPLLRVYVLTENEVDEARRGDIQQKACDALPGAVRAWVRETPSISFDPATGFVGIES